ncbi:hypothetical protein Verru16b_00701 [Lacunisphaera limnophila]|uniref:Peptidase C39-like domain-containing protein n=1 Tax=Lacunisphaera limnophila TaxID=1838286 RepID=A0A1D8AS06_9BACT|nr:hypothetical protein [Lacunisphaera limnophila]AOS43649.1 hypothetical protein Verru16b_00701 [Lacunisphaera limnophila]
MRPPYLLLCAALLAATPLPQSAATLKLPRMPSPEFVPSVSAGVPLSGAEIRIQLQSLLPAGTVLVRDVEAPTAGTEAGTETGSEATRGEPHTVAATLGRHPVIDLADSHYAPLRQEFIPVLVDWFEALATSLDTTPAQMRAAGFRTNKVARLMRVFTAVRLHRDHGQDPGMEPAIGWCRILLQQDWGRCLQGETHTFVLVATDRGWFIIDPFTRRMQRLEKDDPRWLVEFVVI